MQNVYSVAQVNNYIKNMFVQDFMLNAIAVRGEISNVKYHSSGHIYFTLKDQNGTLACVMFKGNRTGLKFQMTEGQQIVASGSVDVYERDGKYQLYAREIELDGGGLLYEKFLNLKQELEEMGMFAAEYKQKIPRYVKTIGVVTAPTGAAVRDIIQIAKRRNPYIQIILYPAIVQGEAAAKSIVNGIHALEEKEVDVIIVGRGGGSIEDLWAFNERIVAEAVFDCSVPIISAVGHETDTTIIDFVADLRAPTPSGAAELAVADLTQTYGIMAAYKERMNRLVTQHIRQEKAVCLQLEIRLKHQNPAYKIRQERTYLIGIEEKLKGFMEQIFQKRRHIMELYIARLSGVSPLEKLNQGYSFVTDLEGNSIKDVTLLAPKDTIIVTLRDGRIKAEVEEVYREGSDYDR